MMMFAEQQVDSILEQLEVPREGDIVAKRGKIKQWCGVVDWECIGEYWGGDEEEDCGEDGGEDNREDNGYEDMEDGGEDDGEEDGEEDEEDNEEDYGDDNEEDYGDDEQGGSWC
jgi:hypothetical protein